MRFEKLNEDKIRITLNTEDLEKKDIDLHTFMSNSIESQDLFFDMLEEAEKQIGFVTKANGSSGSFGFVVVILITGSASFLSFPVFLMLE